MKKLTNGLLTKMKDDSINSLKMLKKILLNLIPLTLLNLLKKPLIHKGRHCFIIKPLEIIGADRIVLGNSVHIGNNSTLCCYEGNVVIGSGTFVTSHLNLFCGQEIRIGNDVLIASYVLITDLTHGINPEININYQKQKITTDSVIIEDGCWIGDKVSILPGTHIGEKCVIGANTVIKGRIPAFSMVAGNPGRIIKRWDFEKKEWARIECSK